MADTPDQKPVADVVDMLAAARRPEESPLSSPATADWGVDSFADGDGGQLDAADVSIQTSHH
jgi:hypothetical protein